MKEKKDLEWEALLKKSQAELKAKHQYATFLEKQVKGLEKKLQEAESQYEVKVGNYSYFNYHLTIELFFNKFLKFRSSLTHVYL